MQGASSTVLNFDIRKALYSSIALIFRFYNSFLYNDIDIKVNSSEVISGFCSINFIKPSRTSSVTKCAIIHIINSSSSKIFLKAFSSLFFIFSFTLITYFNFINYSVISKPFIFNSINVITNMLTKHLFISLILSKICSNFRHYMSIFFFR